MPLESSVAVCGNCGAQIDPIPGRSTVACSYCGRTTVIGASVSAAVSASVPSDFASAPPMDNIGTGARHTTSDRTAWVSSERSIWPVRGSASSSYGSAWSPSVLIGPPRVFPRCGDIAGAWAPRAHTSESEWIEVEYGAGVPVSAIRVFETHRAGSTYAVVDRTDSDTVLWSSQPQSLSGAQVLEIAVSPPRVIRKLRVYLTNDGWAEIDTVGLVAASPLPMQLRSRTDTLLPRRRGGGLVALALVGALVAIVASAVIKGSRAGPKPVPTGVAAMGWSDNLTEFRGANGRVISVRCPPGGTLGTVWGSDTYSDDSSVCTAAVHAGRIDRANGGIVRVELQPGQDHYEASTRNGVTTRSYGAWTGSFVLR